MQNLFIFGPKVTATLNQSCCSKTLQTLWNGFCCTAGTIDFLPENNFIMKIGDVRPLPLENCDFSISVTTDGFCIAAEDRRGLLNGYMALLRQIRPICLERGSEQFFIPCGEIYGKPAVKKRMVHLCVFPETTLPFITKFVRLCGVLNYTHLVLEFWGTLHFDCLKELSWPQALTKEQIKPIIKEANDMGLEIIPMFNHLGHAAASRGIHGKHVVLDQNPRLQGRFDEDGWTWNITKPEVRGLFQKIRRELYELCGGSYFHIGCDEAYRYGGENADISLLTRFLNETAAEIAGEGRRPIMWGDMLLNSEAAGVQEGYTCNCRNSKAAESLLTSLDKRLVIADWQYDVTRSPVLTAGYLSSFGFDTLLCPWYDFKNIGACVETAQQMNNSGVMLTTWHTLSARMFSLLACAQGCLTGKVNFAGRDYAAETAALIRKVYFADGDYETAGWAKHQISEITL